MEGTEVETELDVGLEPVGDGEFAALDDLRLEVRLAGVVVVIVVIAVMETEGRRGDRGCGEEKDPIDEVDVDVDSTGLERESL